MLFDFSHALRVQIISGCPNCAAEEISKITPILQQRGNVIWAEVAAPMNEVKETFMGMFSGSALPFQFVI